MYRVRRRRTLLGTVAVLLLGYVAFSGAGRLPSDSGRLPDDHSHAPNDAGRALSRVRTGLAGGQLAAGRASGVRARRRPRGREPGPAPAPIASLAKVMTAYLTLERYPISGEQEGFTITVTAADAQAAADDAARNQSIVAVQAGEQLTERQLLEALLIPSGNNIA